MDLNHDSLVYLSKSIGLLYLVGLSVVIVAYAYWPSNRQRFDRAADAILEDEDRPWR
jgi:cytochrome c oxidase cbb3-type subunit IV